MRPLPIERFPGAPAFVLGVSVIRGMSVPVVDLALLLGADEADHAARRYVTLKLEARDVALSVGEVLGVRDLDPARLFGLPALVDAARCDAIAALGTLDAELLRVLSAANVLSESTWNASSVPEAQP
jgi:purine-binding chemotaxis protein CheW